MGRKPTPSRPIIKVYAVLRHRKSGASKRVSRAAWERYQRRFARRWWRHWIFEDFASGDGKSPTLIRI